MTLGIAALLLVLAAAEPPAEDGPLPDPDRKKAAEETVETCQSCTARHKALQRLQDARTGAPLVPPER